MANDFLDNREIADKLCEAAGFKDQKSKDFFEDILFDIKTISENPYNKKSYKVFYEILNSLAEKL